MSKRKKVIRKNFVSRLHLIAGGDNFRPHLDHIWFKNGFVYATNAYCIIRQSLEFNGFTDAEIELMNGNAIHKKQFQQIIKHDRIAATADGIFADDTLYKWVKTEKDYPDAEAFIKKELAAEIDWVEKIGLKPNLITLACKAMYNPFPGILVFGLVHKTKAVHISSPMHTAEQQICFLMPAATE